MSGQVISGPKSDLSKDGKPHEVGSEGLSEGASSFNPYQESKAQTI